MLVTLVMAVVWLSAPTTAHALVEHPFDPVLSLRGDALTDSTDEVPDPGPLHPPKRFRDTCGTAVDRHGDIYVASAGPADLNPQNRNTEGRIDVFNPQGEYLTEIKDELHPCSLAVDSLGNLYVVNFNDEPGRVFLFKPSAYPPTVGTEYGPPTAIYTEQAELGSFPRPIAVAVDPSNDHVYVTINGGGINEYDSAAAGSSLLRNIDPSFGEKYGGIDVYGANHDIYVSGLAGGTPNERQLDPESQRVFIMNANGELKREINGSAVPGGFAFISGQAEIAVDQANGDFYVDDVGEHHVVDEFDSNGQLIAQLAHSFTHDEYGRLSAAIAVDDPLVPGEPGYDSPNPGHVYVAVGETPAKAHLYAFSPPPAGPRPPDISEQTVRTVSDTEAVLEAKLNANGQPTTYHFEYTTQTDYTENGYANALSAPIPEASLAGVTEAAPVAIRVTGLHPDTPYRFRLVASNHCDDEQPEALCTTVGEGQPGGVGADAFFSTYAAELGLPDGRAYELVTPPDTNGRVPTMAELGSGFNASGFNTALASPSGDSVVFGTEGGSIPSLGGGGFHDTYDSLRTSAGWQSHFNGIGAELAERPHPGGIAADHNLAFWEVEGDNGPLATHLPGNYLRRDQGVLDPACSPEPASHFEWVGCGSIGQDPLAEGKWISPDGGHVIVLSDKGNTPGAEAIQLEPCAAPTGTASIYDRTPDGVTHCISVRPDGSPFDESARYKGSSVDGSAVAFAVGETLYAHLDDAKTVEVAGGNVVFAGISDNGSRVFYLRPNAAAPLLPGTEIPQGEILACEVRLGPCAGPDAVQSPLAIGSGDEAVVVNISPDGSHAYFVSPQELLPGEGSGGKDNLYVWDGNGGGLGFIATLEPSDVIGEGSEGDATDGLGLWIPGALAPKATPALGAAVDPARSSGDGSVLLFESRAKLNGYENAGHSEVYLYRAGSESGSLDCVSCNPTGSSATTDAQLQSHFGNEFNTFPPVNSATPVANLTTDGRKAFFQTKERLATGDVDGKLDVYEWEDEGTGDCARAGGCISLISGGQSHGDDYLYAVSPSGNDVFFESGDSLVAQDPDPTPSIYDARAPHVLGEAVGFQPDPPPPAECTGEACQPPSAAPTEVTPSSSVFQGPGNRKPTHCVKHRRHNAHGGARCGHNRRLRHPRKHHHRRSHSDRRSKR